MTTSRIANASNEGNRCN